MSNKSKVRTPLSVPRTPFDVVFDVGVVLQPLPDHLQGARRRATRQEAAVPVPWSWLRRRLQGYPADIQVRRTAMVQ